MAAEHRFSGMFGAVDRIAEQGRRLLDLPSPIWRPSHPWRRWMPEQAKGLLKALHRDGIVFLPEFLNKDQLARVQAAIEARFTPSLAQEMEFSPSNQYYACRQPLAICPEFAEAAIDPDLLDLVGGYFRRIPLLYEPDFRRVLPLDPAEQERRDAKFTKQKQCVSA